jgi:predicted ATPase
MLTRLKVDGFKNLVGVDLRFGPFTCIAGANGAGKSNLFDAIRFLSLTASHSLIEAARRVRDESGQNNDVRGLFHRSGSHVARKISFEADLIVPGMATDDIGQKANAARQYLTYRLDIQLREGGRTSSSKHPLEVVREELVMASNGVEFPVLNWVRARGGGIERDTKTFGRWVAPLLSPLQEFIVTERKGSGANIKLKSEGRRTPVNQAALINPTGSLLSVATANGSPTAYCAQRELKSWQLLQLDPGALRQPDEFHAPSHLAANGRHLAAVLARLTAPPDSSLQDAISQDTYGDGVCAKLANRLSGLVSEVRGIRLDRDEKRTLNTVLLQMRDGTEFPARAMSDGTLRLLALALLELDPEAPRLICLEEPENGIHPDPVPAILRLLQDIAVDPMEPLDDSNPVRQVMVNTHSPSVVMAVPEDSLVVARSAPGIDGAQVFTRVEFAGLAGTWRAKAVPQVPAVSKGELLSYLDPAGMLGGDHGGPPSGTRVVDRTDLRSLLEE